VNGGCCSVAACEFPASKNSMQYVLAVWLATVPLATKSVPCLFISVHLVTAETTRQLHTGPASLKLVKSNYG
jgi:hypothetical protein